MKTNELIPIGTKIKVDKTKLKNVLPKKLIDDLPEIILGKVIDYKMTDGMDIGYVLHTERNMKIWIFNNELDQETRKKFNLNETYRFRDDSKNQLSLWKDSINYELTGTKKIQTLFNPINLFSWLIFTLKDIF